MTLTKLKYTFVYGEVNKNLTPNSVFGSGFPFLTTIYDVELPIKDQLRQQYPYNK